MSCTCVVGLQWGDEAKGKIVDLISGDHDFAVRYNGGANAGHTIVFGGRTYKLSLLPTGVLHSHLHSIIGNGVVVFPPRFIEEVDQLLQGGVRVDSNLSVSEHAHVIFPYHMEEEKLTEQGGSGSNAIGTTGRGIGPCYADKVGRVGGIRVGDLLKPDYLRERLRFIVPRKNRLIAAFTDGQGASFDANQLADQYLGYAERLRPFIQNTTRILQDGLKAGKRILFEAAQGSLLDIDHGTFPFVTSSSSLPSGIWTGSGVSTRKVQRIIGVLKAYTTRVGRGPFPTELNDGPDGIGERIRKIGREYGTVTGRPRRVGWFDLMAVRYTAALADVNEVTLMLLDVLSGLERVALCTGYQRGGERIDFFPSDAEELATCEPVLEWLPGWKEDISTARKWSDLPLNAQRYVERIGEALGLPVSVVSVGPDRAQTIIR